MLGAALQIPIVTAPVPFDRYVEQLCRGEIDLFGPLMAGANCPSNIRFSSPLNRMGLSVLMRHRSTSGLAPLPPPASLHDLINRDYAIAVLKDTRGHLFCRTELRRSEESLIVCSSDEEAIERLLLKGISRPAHLMVTNSVFAGQQAALQPDGLYTLFNADGSTLDMCDNSLAIRPDWAHLHPEIDGALVATLARGGFAERFRTLAQAIGVGQLEAIDYSDTGS